MATNGPLRRTQLVNLSCHQFLSDAAFAFEEHGEVRGGYPLDRRAESLHRGRGSD
jgi:hypothetical protein